MNEASRTSPVEIEPLFKKAWEISTDGLRLMNLQGQIIQVNPAYCEMIQLPSDQLTGELFTTVYHEDARTAIMNSFLEEIHNNKIENQTNFERDLWNGSHIWFEITNSFIELDSETFVLSHFKDITKRKEAQMALVQSEQQFRLIFNSANDSVFVNELTRDHTLGKFLEVNNLTTYRLLYSMEDFKNLNPYQLIPPKFHKQLKNILITLLKEKHALYEIEFLRKDNSRIPVEISAHLFEFKNQPAVLSIARDITERKRSEKERHLRSTQLRNLATRLQDIREEERSMLAREIHDELGQVLTVLKIQIVLLSNKIKTTDPDIAKQFSELAALIDQSVGSVQRISAKLRPGILDELGLLAAIEWQAKDFEKRTGIQCKYSFPEEDIELAPEMSTAIFRILQEALTNVARHSNAERVSIYLKKADESLVLEVTDNGHGISQSQIDNPKSLGLLGMKERALVLGGTFTINGLTHKGTNVKVLMPMESS